jgi:hypothetical protein
MPTTMATTLSSSPTSINYFERRLTLKEFLKELPITIESSHESLVQQQEGEGQTIAELFG